MPHAVFKLSSQGASADLQPRLLIPGIEPGGSRVGEPMKPALLIKDAYVELQDATPAANNYSVCDVYLKLSKGVTLDPGLILLIAVLHAGVDSATSGANAAWQVEQLGEKIAGTIWTPGYVGVRLRVSAGNWDLDVHLDYERIEIPWMDWFLMWDFLDNVVNNSRDY